MAGSTPIGQKNQLNQITPMTGNEEARRALRGPSAGAAGGTRASFSELLRVRQGIAPPASGVDLTSSGLRFSAHAQTRLQSRQIALNQDHLDRLKNAVQSAAGKGSRDALVLLDDMAMVVSVKNRTVVTVVDKEHLQQNVFTNIDSAVIA